MLSIISQSCRKLSDQCFNTALFIVFSSSSPSPSCHVCIHVNTSLWFYFHNGLTSNNFTFYWRFCFLCGISYSIEQKFCYPFPSISLYWVYILPSILLHIFLLIFLWEKERATSAAVSVALNVSDIPLHLLLHLKRSVHGTGSAVTAPHQVSSGDHSSQSFFNPLVDFREQH